jgi:predicted transcriptional regulator
VLDGADSQGYDPAMSEPRPAEQLRPTSDDAEREAFMVAVEDGLADLKAGRVYTHAEVQAEMRRLFPPPSST